MQFARWVFRLAAIYGVIVLTPFYFLESQISAASPEPITHLENYYGFVGTALAFQALFFVISSDPTRYRPAMIPSVLEKVLFAGAVIPLWFVGRVPGAVAVFATIDLVWGVLFTVSWFKMRPAA